MNKIRIVSTLFVLSCLLLPLTSLAVVNPVLSMAVNGTITSGGSDMVAGTTLKAYCGSDGSEVGRTVLAVDGQYGPQNTSLPVNECASGTTIYVQAVSGSTITEKKATLFSFTAAEITTCNIAFAGSTGIAVESIAVTPVTASKPAGKTQQFTSTATYYDATTADITTLCTWTSGTTAVATIGSATGLATGVALGTSEITASFTDDEGTTSTDTATLTVSVSIPTGLSASAASTSQINVSWTAMTGATSYKVYRDSSLVGSPTTNSYSDTGLTAGTAYSYTVLAVNSDGETSQSSAVSATTTSAGGAVIGGGGGTTTPTMPSTTTGSVTATRTAGGTTTFTATASNKVTVKVPAYAVSASTDIAVSKKSITASAVSAAVSAVASGKSIVGNYVYDITAESGGEAVTEFDKDITITLTYTDAQITGLKRSSLAINYWDEDESEWNALATTVYKRSNKLVAKTDHFTYFAIIGEEGEDEEEVVTPITEMTIAEIKAMIADILAQIKVLQAELNKLIGVSVEGCTITSFDRSLKLGMTGDDVKCLQIILNSASDTRVADTGVGSAGNETNYFGSLTKTAVIKFQEKYADDILAEWNLTAGTGYVGTTTLDKLNSLLK